MKGSNTLQVQAMLKSEIESFSLHFGSPKQKKNTCLLPLLFFSHPLPPLHMDKELVTLPTLPLNDLDAST